MLRERNEVQLGTRELCVLLMGAKLAREDLKFIDSMLVLVPLLAVHLVIRMSFPKDFNETIILQIVQYRVE